MLISTQHDKMTESKEFKEFSERERDYRQRRKNVKKKWEGISVTWSNVLLENHLELTPDQSPYRRSSKEKYFQTSKVYAIQGPSFKEL